MTNATTDGLVLPQAADLHLFVMDRPVHPELFRHFADYRVRQTRYHADLWLTGLSHVVTVHTGDVSLTEIIALDNELLPAHGIVTRFRMKGERDLEKVTPAGWNYMVSTQVELMEEPLYKSVHQDLLAHALKRGTAVVFDQWAMEGDVAPFSYLDTEARDSEFHIHAFHAFPAERTIVKTQTILELPN